MSARQARQWLPIAACVAVSAIAACEPEGLTTVGVAQTPSASASAKAGAASPGTPNAGVVTTAPTATPSKAPSPLPSAFVQVFASPETPAQPASPFVQPAQNPGTAANPPFQPLPSVATPTPSPATPNLNCSNGVATQVIPTLVAPGTVFYVKGTGFKGDVKIQIGNMAAEVLRIEPTRITARVPAAMPVNGQAVPVSVKTCDTALQASVTVASTFDFSGNVTVAEQGMLTSIYPLANGTTSLPADLDTRTPRNTFLASQINVTERDFTVGFPGVAGALTEFFALRYDGRLEVAHSGIHEFRLLSDDGARLYVDGTLVVDNDGTHAVRSVIGQAELLQGTHTFRVDYFQGPATRLALQVFWTRPPEALSKSPWPEEMLPGTLLTIPAGLAQ